LFEFSADSSGTAILSIGGRVANSADFLMGYVLGLRLVLAVLWVWTETAEKNGALKTIVAVRRRTGASRREKVEFKKIGSLGGPSEGA